MTTLICDRFEDALVVYAVNQWTDRDTNIPIGRTLIQKLMYFIKAKDVPVSYSFHIQQYGPYSQDLSYRLDDLVADGLICDESDTPTKSDYRLGANNQEILDLHAEPLSQHREHINSIIDLFAGSQTDKMELLATIHYIHTSFAKFYNTPPEKQKVTDKVSKAKGTRFSPDQVSLAYDSLKKTELLN